MAQQLMERTSETTPAGRGYGAVLHEAVVRIGERLGFYERIAEAGEVTETTFAKSVAMNVAHVRWWLRTQADAGYLDRDETTGVYRLWCPLPQAQ